MRENLMNCNIYPIIHNLPDEVKKLLEHEPANRWIRVLDKAQENNLNRCGEYLVLLFDQMVKSEIHQSLLIPIIAKLTDMKSAKRLSLITEKNFDIAYQNAENNKNKPIKEILNTTGLPLELTNLVWEYAKEEPPPGEKAVFHCSMDKSNVNIALNLVTTVFALENESLYSMCKGTPTIKGIFIIYQINKQGTRYKEEDRNEEPYLLSIWFSSAMPQESIVNYLERNNINISNLSIEKSIIEGTKKLKCSKKIEVKKLIDLIVQDNDFADPKIVTKLYALIERFTD